MPRLDQQKCEACKSDAPRVSAGEKAELMSQLDSWRVDEEKGAPQLLKAYGFPDFIQAQAFVKKVAEVADKGGQHPALLIEWGRVTVRRWTHKLLGVHRNNFIMASNTDAIFTDNI